MKRKLRIFSNIAIICLSVCMFAFGVYAASTVSVTTSGTVTFSATGVYAEVTRTITGAKNAPSSTTVSIDASAAENAEYPMNADLEFEDGDTLLTISFEIDNKATDRCMYVTLQEGDSTMVNNNVEQVAEYLNTEIMISASESKTINIYLYVKDSNKSATATYDYKMSLKSTTAGTVLTENDVELEDNHDGTCTINKITSTASHITIPEKIGEYTVAKLYTSSSNIFGEAYYSSDTNTTLQHITMPNNIEIEEYSGPVFAGCKSLKYIAIPESWECLAMETFKNTIIETLVLPKIEVIEGYSLSSTKLTTLIIPESVTVMSDAICTTDWYSIKLTIYKGSVNDWATKISDKDTDGGYPAIDDNLFCDGRRVHGDITLSGETIRTSAFHGFETIKTVTFTDTVKTIKDYAFSSCKNITLVIMPTSITKIGTCAFYFSGYSFDINYSGTKEQFLAIDMDYSSMAIGSVSVVHCTDGDLTVEELDQHYNA